MTFSTFVLVVGLLLTILGGFAGTYLLLFSIGNLEKANTNINIASLWGLFVGGIALGILFSWLGWP